MTRETIRLVEHYTSIQGEGPRTGVPTQFVRFAGCNLRCPGWPCDTQYAIQPSIYLKNSWAWTPDLLAAQIVDEASHGASNIAFTGGEPLVQSDGLMETIGLLPSWYTVELFTNGTKQIPDVWFKYELMQVNLDFKLPGSGEFNWPQSVLEDNIRRLKPTDMIKFVCKDLGDFNTAVETMRRLPTNATFWFGVVWNCNFSTATLIEELRKLGLLNSKRIRVNVQVHKYIWPRVEKGV